MLEVRAFIDRREGDRVVLLVGPESVPVDWPAACLPPNVAPGEYLIMRVMPDRDETTARKARVEDLIRRLTEEPKG